MNKYFFNIPICFIGAGFRIQNRSDPVFFLDTDPVFKFLWIRIRFQYLRILGTKVYRKKGNRLIENNKIDWKSSWPGSGSEIRIRFDPRGWIRIRPISDRIQNPIPHILKHLMRPAWWRTCRRCRRRAWERGAGRACWWRRSRAAGTGRTPTRYPYQQTQYLQLKSIAWLVPLWRWQFLIVSSKFWMRENLYGDLFPYSFLTPFLTHTLGKSLHIPSMSHIVISFDCVIYLIS